MALTWKRLARETVECLLTLNNETGVTCRVAMDNRSQILIKSDQLWIRWMQMNVYHTQHSSDVGKSKASYRNYTSTTIWPGY